MSEGTAMSIRGDLLLSLLTNTMSGHLRSVTWSVWIFVSQRIFTLCISMTSSAVCWYHCSECFLLYISQRLHWTAPATVLSLLVLQLCHFTTFAYYVYDCLFSVLAPPARCFTFLFVYFDVDCVELP